MPSDQTLRQSSTPSTTPTGLREAQGAHGREDPEDFAKWNAHRRKLIRSLEVFLLSGKSMSSALSAWKEHGPRRDFLCFKLVWERQALKRRIAERCDAMLAQGWLEEAEELLAAGLLASPTARQALGYSLIARHLSGELTLEELAAAIKTATWQYARRQTTWFKHQHPEAVELRMPSGPEPIIAAFEKARRP
jgi:tRNA dimethylallyltransferase